MAQREPHNSGEPVHALPAGAQPSIRERATDRGRRAALTAATSMAAKVIQVCVSLFTVPLTLRYLGAERFGLWMTINAVLAMASFADFGIGNGLLNVIAEASGNDDVAGVRTAVSSGFAILTAIAAALLLCFSLIFPWVHWAHFFGASTPLASAEAPRAVAVFAICFALNISVDVVQRVQLGLQQGYRYGVWQCVGSVLALVGVLTAIHARAGLPVLVAAMAGAPVLATACNALHFFTGVRPDLRPAWAGVSGSVMRRLSRLGSLFFVLQLVSAVSFSGDNFILARTLGAASVPDYAIPQRLFAILAMVAMMLIAPLWPAYGEALARSDRAWIRRTLLRSLLLTAAATAVAGAALLLLAPRLLRLWVGTAVHPQAAMLLGLALWAVLGNTGYAMETFLNGIGRVRIQVAVSSAFGLGCILLKVAWIRRFGASALPWATIASYLLCSALPVGLYATRLLRTMRAEGERREPREHAVLALAVRQP